MNTIHIEFDKLEFGTTFKSYSGTQWIKLNEQFAIEPDDDIDNPQTYYRFSPDEIVTVE